MAASFVVMRCLASQKLILSEIWNLQCRFLVVADVISVTCARRVTEMAPSNTVLNRPPNGFHLIYIRAVLKRRLICVYSGAAVGSGQLVPVERRYIQRPASVQELQAGQSAVCLRAESTARWNRRQSQRCRSRYDYCNVISLPFIAILMNLYKSKVRHYRQH